MRDKYIEMRKAHSYDLQWFYQYYVENFPKLREFIVNGVSTPRHQLSFHDFVELFRMALQMDGQNILNYLDKKFEVSKIENENGELIYIN